MKITEAKIKFKDGLVDEVQVLIPDGESYKAYGTSNKITSGYYYLQGCTVITQSIIENTARFGMKISAAHHFPKYFQK